MTRRRFLQLPAVFTALSYKQILGANEKISIGFIGTSDSMGIANLKTCLRRLNVRISYVCDVFEDNLIKAMRLAPQARPTRYFMEVLDDSHRQGVDAVCLSVPDHWHAYMFVEAAKRNLAIYCEKPIAHSVAEAVLMIHSAEKHRIIAQIGSWQRSAEHFQKAVDYVQSGLLGKIISVKSWKNEKWNGIGNPPDSDPPPGLGEWGWNMFLGPAPMRNYNKNRFLFYWRWFWDTGNGYPADWGPHATDICQWPHWQMWNSQPITVASMGSVFSNDIETPHVWQSQYQTGQHQTTFEYDGSAETPSDKEKQFGIEWLGENGSVLVNREFLRLKDKDGKIVKEFAGDELAHEKHWEDFLRCIRNNNRETRASLRQVGPSNIMCLLGVSAYKYGRPITWDPVKMRTDDKEAQKFLQYHYREPWKLKL